MTELELSVLYHVVLLWGTTDEWALHIRKNEWDTFNALVDAGVVFEDDGYLYFRDADVAQEVHDYGTAYRKELLKYIGQLNRH